MKAGKLKYGRTLMAAIAIIGAVNFFSPEPYRDEIMKAKIRSHHLDMVRQDFNRARYNLSKLDIDEEVKKEIRRDVGKGGKGLIFVHTLKSLPKDTRNHIFKLAEAWYEARKVMLPMVTTPLKHGNFVFGLGDGFESQDELEQAVESAKESLEKGAKEMTKAIESIQYSGGENKAIEMILGDLKSWQLGAHQTIDNLERSIRRHKNDSSQRNHVMWTWGMSMVGPEIARDPDGFVRNGPKKIYKSLTMRIFD